MAARLTAQETAAYIRGLADGRNAEDRVTILAGARIVELAGRAHPAEIAALIDTFVDPLKQG